MSKKEKLELREQQIIEIINEMTLDEKIGMLHGAGLFRTEGVARLGIPPVKFSDGPMGVRQEMKNDRWRAAYGMDDMVTYLPSNSAIAATWNPKLAKECGRVLGEEARGRGKDVILGPGINIKRTPLCGRNFEYMSEDPYLVSEMTVPLIEGIQENDVAACVKHFAANGQETNRLWVDTIVDERTLNEIYFPGFEAAVNRAHSYSLMGAYNLLNGQHCCESKALLNEQLRKKWNYDGMVVSDWSGVHNTKAVAESALDIEMSVTNNFDEYFMANPLKEEIKAGRISEAHIDEKLRNILRMMFRLNMLGENRDKRKKGKYHSISHIKSAKEAARESVILLKNESNVLPLKRTDKVAVIGYNAECVHSNGGGSAEIKSIYEVTPLLAMRSTLGGNTEVIYEPGYYVPKRKAKQSESWQEKSLDDIVNANIDINASPLTDKELKKIEKYREKAVRLATENEQVVIFAGLNHDYDMEGLDKTTLKLPYYQDELIEAVLDANENAVVVIMAGAPVEMPWLNKAKSIVWYYYAGLEGATAVVEVLTGKVNPSGKLPESFPKSTMDLYPVKLGEFGKRDVVEYKDGVFVGYRYYETENVDVNFCFGHGLSYTYFDISEPELKVSEETGNVKVSMELSNLGDRAGKETIQLYVTDVKATVPRPVMELKAFKKLELDKNETKKISFELDKSAFAFYDVNSHDWVVEPGEFVISIGFSLKDIRQKVIVNM